MPIGTLNEKPLHAALKQFYARPGDLTETPVDGFVIDVVCGDLLIEIQTRGVTAIRRKLQTLAGRYPLRLAVPVAQATWITRLAQDGVTVAGRRRSPRRGSVEQVFAELVSIPRLLLHPNFTLEVLMVDVEELRRPDPTVNWRRHGWAVCERRLLAVASRHVFETPAQLGGLLPAGLPDPFTARDLAAALGRPLRLAQQMAYCLREVEVLDMVGTQARSRLYARASG